MKNHLIKVTLFVIIIFSLSGCATLPNQSEIETGPRRAKFNLKYTMLDKRKGGLNHLRILSATFHESEGKLNKQGKCVFPKISHMDGGNSVYIQADKRVVLTLWYRHTWTLFNYKNRENSYTDVSFLPENNKEYTLEYVDMGGKYKVNLYENLSDGKTKHMEIQSFPSCK